MEYIESYNSRKMMELNKEYIELYYSAAYQAYIKKKKLSRLLKEKKFNEIFYIIKGRFLKRKLVNNEPEKINIQTKDPLKAEEEKFIWVIDELPKVVVYTCIVNGYDDLEEPCYINPDIDYIIFTDMEIKPDSVWKKRDISAYEQFHGMTSIEINRYIKMHPQEFFVQYDISIYIDGTIKILADMMPIALNMGEKYFGVHKHGYRDCIYMEAEGVIYSKRADPDLTRQQIRDYFINGYPRHAGLYENTILVRRHNNEGCIKLMKAWWDEYVKYPTRDQISLPYIMWKCEIREEEICILESPIEKNYRFRRKRGHLK